MQRSTLLSAICLTLLTACGGSASPRVAPTCLPNGSCPGSYYLAAAEPGGIALFADPYSGSAHVSLAPSNVESFARFPTVDTPTTWLAAVAPNTLYTYDYPYAAPDGTITLPVRDVSQMALVFLPAPGDAAMPLRLLVADAVNNDLVFIDLNAKPPAVSQTIDGLDRPNAFEADMQGNLWVAEASDIAIFTIQTDGTFVRTATISSGLSRPDGIYRYYDGSMYVADAGNNTIEAFAPNSTAPSFSVSSGLNRPGSLIESFGNTLFVANTGDNSIAAFALPLTATSAPLWINRNLSGTPRALTTWFSPSF